MKKRSKQKSMAQSRSQQQDFTSFSEQTIIRRSRDFPLVECLINPDWQEEMSLTRILIARQQPDGDICFGTYLVDRLCLGLKNTFANANVSRSRYNSEIRERIFQGTRPIECPLELAQQIIYASIDYAAQFGFQPNKDWALSQYLLRPRGELAESYELTFGKDGKPFFAAGPHDNAAQIIRQLDKTAGPGNYHYITPADMF